MPEQVNILFYSELGDLLPANLREKSIHCELSQSRSVKDLVESMGIPHTEIDLLVVNGESVGFDYLLQGGEQVTVYPPGNAPDVSPLQHCQPAPLTNPGFVLDTHLGRLAAYMRMLGFDTLYRNDYDDSELAEITDTEKRVLLSCDRKLLMRKQVVYGYFVRSRNPKKQILEVLSRFDLYNSIHPFTRCMHCNGEIYAVKKQYVESQLSPRTRKYYNEFYQCTVCNKIYWKGSHYLKMKKMIGSLTPTNEDRKIT